MSSRPLLLTTLLILLFSATVEARAEEPYAAIAFSTESGRYGWAYNYPSASEAEAAALKYSEDRTAKVVTCRNDYDYFVLATGGNGKIYGYGYGTSLEIARSYAVAEVYKRTRQNIKIVVKFHRTKGKL